jgi:hypothetical protein
MRGRCLSASFARGVRLHFGARRGCRRKPQSSWLQLIKKLMFCNQSSPPRTARTRFCARAAASASLLVSQQDLHAVPHRVDEQVNLAAHWNAHVAPTLA